MPITKTQLWAYVPCSLSRRAGRQIHSELHLSQLQAAANSLHIDAVPDVNAIGQMTPSV